MPSINKLTTWYVKAKSKHPFLLYISLYFVIVITLPITVPLTLLILLISVLTTELLHGLKEYQRWKEKEND